MGGIQKDQSQLPVIPCRLVERTDSTAEGDRQVAAVELSGGEAGREQVDRLLRFAERRLADRQVPCSFVGRPLRAPVETVAVVVQPDNPASKPGLASRFTTPVNRD